MRIYVERRKAERAQGLESPMQGGRSSRDKNSLCEKAVALPARSSCAASEYPLCSFAWVGTASSEKVICWEVPAKILGRSGKWNLCFLKIAPWSVVTSDALELKPEHFLCFPSFGICPGRGLCCAGKVHSLLKTLLNVKCETKPLLTSYQSYNRKSRTC